MRRSPVLRGAILGGLLATSLALHWAASAGRGVLVALFVGLAGLALAAVWSLR